MAEKKKLRCAIYTRKSTEDGLEQEFNSLDAQYEACAAYAVSQRHEGWVLNPERYDDGGFSGGNMQRPGLKRLMADVAAGKVDIILLYKIDRLTRSLADFAKIVEVLDKAGASFVSITQSFNTTTSMGRLTLNMLLSFAQFEREVTSERIRDKIAASKRRGMWMGGEVPVGYLVSDRKLIINEPLAELIRHLMRRYLALGSVAALLFELQREGRRTEIKVSAAGNERGGGHYSRGMLYRLLTNPVYRGMISHKGQLFPGEHTAIVSQELWKQVQDTMTGKTQGHSRRLKAKDPSLLVGILTDGEGRAMTPSHTVKGKVRYRYYRTRIDLVDGSPAWHVSARDLEQLVCDRVAMFLGDPHALLDSIGNDIDAKDTARVLDTSSSLSGSLRSGPSLIRADLLTKFVSGVELRSDEVVIRLSHEELRESCGLLADGDSSAAPIELICPATRVWHGRQLRLIIPGPFRASDQRHLDPKLIGLMREAYEARQLVLANPDQPLRRLASSYSRCRNRLTRLIAISCLAPDIVVAILEGHQPLGFLSKTLFEVDLPLEWEGQRRVLGFV